MITNKYSYSISKATYTKRKLIATAITILAILTATIPSIASLKGMASAKGGGTPGEGVTYIVRYDAASCPLPTNVKADYVQILSCGLVKRTGVNKDYYIRVDGFTQLTPVIRDVRGTTNVTLACGRVATVSKFTENSFAQTSPVPPPYRLYTESARFTDLCL